MTFVEKLIYKTKKDPLVPIGLSCTVASLLTGIYAFHHKHTFQSLRMMKSRIIFQGMTVAAVGLSQFRC
jgi:hypothetical protein